MRKIMIITALIITVAVALLILITPSQASFSSYCGPDETNICIWLFEIFPEEIENTVMNIPGVLEYTVVDDPFNFHTYIVYNNTNMLFTPAEVQRYFEGLEANLRMNRGLLTVYPDGQSAPLCLLPVGANVPTGIYVVGNSLFLQPNDPRCFGHCADGDICNPQEGPFDGEPKNAHV